MSTQAKIIFLNGVKHYQKVILRKQPYYYSGMKKCIEAIIKCNNTADNVSFFIRDTNKQDKLQTRYAELEEQYYGFCDRQDEIIEESEEAIISEEAEYSEDEYSEDEYPEKDEAIKNNKALTNAFSSLFVMDKATNVREQDLRTYELSSEHRQLKRAKIV